jgi:chloramphenicol 3-O-phosphotransferase
MYYRQTIAYSEREKKYKHLYRQGVLITAAGSSAKTSIMATIQQEAKHGFLLVKVDNIMHLKHKLKQLYNMKCASSFQNVHLYRQFEETGTLKHQK